MMLIWILVGAAALWSAIGLVTGWVATSPVEVAALALATMLVVTGSAHFTRTRPDLVAMVPPMVPWPALAVTLTGLLELVVAAALTFQPTRGPAAVALAALLVLLFPANVYAARSGVPLRGRPPTPLVPRAAVQAVLIALAVWIAANA